MTSNQGPHIVRWEDRDDDDKPVDGGWLDCSTEGDYTVLEVRDDGTLAHVTDVWTVAEAWREIHDELDLYYTYNVHRVFVIIDAKTSKAVASHGDVTRIPKDLRESTIRGMYG